MMGKDIRLRWKQPTPVMQLRAFLFSLEGQTSNANKGIIRSEQFLRTVNLHVQELQALLPYVEKGHW